MYIMYLLFLQSTVLEKIDVSFELHV